jgi:hypothetical protein
LWSSGDGKYISMAGYDYVFFEVVHWFMRNNIRILTLVHSDYRTVSPYWVLPVYVELIRAVWADDGDRPLLF